jgi:hypothetical protein
MTHVYSYVAVTVVGGVILYCFAITKDRRAERKIKLRNFMKYKLKKEREALNIE